MAVTITETTHTSAKKVVFEWVSDGSGDAAGTTSAAYDGECRGFTTIPDGVAAPTDDYDITVTDAAGHDVLLGAGANRDTANTEHVTSASLAAVAGSKLTITVANAGAAKEGTAILWVR